MAGDDEFAKLRAEYEKNKVRHPLTQANAMHSYSWPP
jgi:hypothetical protein